MDEPDTITEPDHAIHSHDDQELMMNHVIQEDHELMYLDTYLSEIFGKDSGQ